jgi:hypothetical protein
MQEQIWKVLVDFTKRAVILYLRNVLDPWHGFLRGTAFGWI